MQPTPQHQRQQPRLVRAPAEHGTVARDTLADDGQDRSHGLLEGVRLFIAVDGRWLTQDFIDEPEPGWMKPWLGEERVGGRDDRHQRADPIGEVGGAGGGGLDVGLEVCAELLERTHLESRDHRLLRRKEPVQRAECGAGPSRQLGSRHCIKAPLGDEVERGPEDLITTKGASPSASPLGLGGQVG